MIRYTNKESFSVLWPNQAAGPPRRLRLPPVGRPMNSSVRSFPPMAHSTAWPTPKYEQCQRHSIRTQGNRLRNNREQKTRKNGFYSTKFGEDRHATLAMTERRSHLSAPKPCHCEERSSLIIRKRLPCIRTSVGFP